MPQSTHVSMAAGLRSLRLIRFRSFKDFSISFQRGALLVGPNNAGKTTVLTAIRLADTLIRFAHRRNPSGSIIDNGIRVMTYPIQLRDFPSLRESVRYEFADAEARVELVWNSGARLVAIWPEESDESEAADPYFYLISESGSTVRTVAQAKSSFVPFGIVPVLTPVDSQEKRLDDAYVRQNVAGRLSSRHFRNQLRILDADKELPNFLEWATPWMGELSLDRIQTSLSDEGPVVTAYLYEGNSRVPKEILWAGDGIQVWIQLLYQLHRVKDRNVIILDEPEVYLHPDLQRRLVRLLDSMEAQVVMASHSTELIAEADGRTTVLIDRTRRHASRPRSEREYETLSTMLGTAFNLRLAKSLRSRVAVFVEGTDMAVFRQIARRLSLSALEKEEGITAIPLNGYSNWRNVEPFRWLVQEILPNALKTFVILDRDYRSDDERDRVVQSLENVGVTGHVWIRKELESYLIVPALISRVSGATESQIIEWLEEITLAMETEVFSRALQERISAEVDAHHHAVSITASFKQDFDLKWESFEYRLISCPPKQIIARLNVRLHKEELRAISVAALARSIRVSEVPAEMSNLLTELNTSASTGG